MPNVPPAVEQVILKALSEKPEERYQLAGELGQALWLAVGLTRRGLKPAPSLLAAAGLARQVRPIYHRYHPSLTA